jgi:hypothetical protein
MVVQNREAATLGEDTAHACREGKEAGGKVWCYSGVVLIFYRGRGSAAEEMPVGNDRGFTADGIDGRGGC